MRKLTAAGIIAAAAMGLSVQAGADTTVYTITGGTFSEVEQRCTQIDSLFAQTDCTYGRNRPQPVDPENPDGVRWMGPLFGGGHYAAGSPGAVLGYIPTKGTEVPPDSLSGIFIPAVPDGKIQAVVTGTLSINDNGTPGNDPANAADDKISSAFAIGPMVRNVSTGATTRANQAWTSMNHVMAEITVSSAAANGNGGVDYVIGSRGFPTKRCNKDNATDCFPTQNSSDSFSQGRFWADIPPNQVGIERSGLMGDPALGLAPPVQPPPAIPRGNVGGQTTATFVGLTCSATSQPPVDDCISSPLVWGGGEPAGFDNIIMQVSTDGTGAITSALAYYSEEYRIAFGGAPAGYDNSSDMGTYSFTAPAPVPTALNFAVSVLENSSSNIVDAAANCITFPGPPTVSIVTQPANGLATEANNTIVYSPNPDYTGPDPIVYQCSTGSTTAPPGTISVTVEEDTLPVAPDGAITPPISTLGAAPGPGTTGTVDVSTLDGYESGNTPSVVTIIPPLAVNGTATVSGTTITYTPSATFFTGTDTVNYRITDSNGDTTGPADDGVITVTIPNVVPILADGSITTDQDRASSPQVLLITPGNGSVAQSPVTVTTGASNGTCAVTGTAAAPTLTYTPAGGYFGPDSCVLTITDGDGSTDTGTFSITVNEVSDALELPGGGGALDLWSLSLLGALPLLRRRRRV